MFRTRSDAATSSPMKLAPITTALLRRQSFGNNHAAVHYCAEIMDVRKPSARDIEPYRRRAGGEKKGAESMLSTVRHLNMPVVNIDRSDVCAKVQVDFVLIIKLC